MIAEGALGRVSDRDCQIEPQRPALARPSLTREDLIVPISPYKHGFLLNIGAYSDYAYHRRSSLPLLLPKDARRSRAAASTNIDTTDRSSHRPDAEQIQLLCTAEVRPYSSCSVHSDPHFLYIVSPYVQS